MKKIFTILAFVLMAFSTSLAQKGYTFVEKSVEKIQTGKDHMYVLRQSNNESTRLMGFLSSKNPTTPVNEVDETCIFNFVKAGEVSHVDSTTMEAHKYNIYVIKNVANGLYLSNSGTLYSTIDKAFQVTAQKAVYQKEEEFDDWFIYSKSSNGCTFDKETPDGLGSWVFCSPYSRHYMTFRMGKATFPYFEYYRSHNAWQVYEVKERVMSAFEKFSIIYNDNFKAEVIPENFPVGNSIGCIPSQDLYNEYESIYKDATDAFDNQDRSDEEYDKLRTSIIDIAKRVKEAVIPFKPGYYLIVSEYRNTAILDPLESKNPWFFGNLDKSAPDNFHFENANYVWKISESEKEGKYTFQNLKTLRYIADSRGNALWWKMGSKPNHFTVESKQGQWFTIANENNAHLSMSSNSYGADDKYVRESNDKGHILWKFESIHPDTLAVLMEPAKQTERNKELQDLYNDAYYAFYSTIYNNQFTFDSQYFEGAEGLADKTNTVTNSLANEGTLEGAFDRNFNTYYHAQYEAGKTPNELHWLQMDLGKEVKEIYVKYSQHKFGNNSNMPVKFSIVTPDEGIEPLKELPWNDTIARCEATHFYPATRNGLTYDSISVIEKIVLDKPAQHIRLAVNSTRGNLIRGGGPCWAVSEFRIIDVADCIENTKRKAIKQEVIDNLKTVMDSAYAELSRKEATEATIEKIQEVTDAFWNEYTLSDKLEVILEKAQMLANNAVEAEEGTEATIGYFQRGAKATLQTIIDKVKSDIENKVLTAAEVDKYHNQVLDGLNAFYNKFVTISESGIYQIVCRAGYDQNDNLFAQDDACLIANNADVTGTPKWGYKQSEGVDGRINTLWYVEKSKAGYSFKNLSNGLYLNNVFEGMTPEEMEAANDSLEISFRTTTYSQIPKHFQLRPAVKGGQLMIALKEGQYLAMRNDNQKSIVHYYTADNAPAQFEFIPVTDEDFDVSLMIFDVPGGKTQIVTLPFESNVVTTVAGNYAHKVLGIKGDYVRLETYSDSDVIPAGCPFIIKTAQTTEDLVDNAINVETSCTSINDLLNMKFNYGSYNQNGLISAPVGFELEPGFGFLFNGMVIISNGGEFVHNGTGFFDKSIPTTTEDGAELMLPIDGKIEGEGTGMDNVTIQKNVNSNIYSISGAIVKHNVKLADATNGLSKGVYIINGKKVIVK